MISLPAAAIHIRALAGAARSARRCPTVQTPTLSNHGGITASPTLQPKMMIKSASLVSGINAFISLRRTNFTYAGPRKLSEILKRDLLDDKSSSEISEIWEAYHEEKEMIHGLTLDSAKGRRVLGRAAQCPFFIHPLFRECGHFMLVSQFQSPNYFLFAYLEDYRTDPVNVQPLLTVSIFDDMAETKGVALVRCDIINRGIDEDEGSRICKFLLEDYADETNFRSVHTFNKLPDAFDHDAFVSEKERRWKT